MACVREFTETEAPPGSGTVTDLQLAELAERLKEVQGSPSSLRFDAIAPKPEVKAEKFKVQSNSSGASTLNSVTGAMLSYDKHFREEFGRDHDHFKLIGQDNFRRYLPVREMRIRVHPDDSAFEIFARVAAAKTVGCRITVSL